MTDLINHPPHYTSAPAKCDKCGDTIECIEVVRHMPFNLGCSVKYIWRAGLKEGASDVQDLEKAIWYLQDEIRLRKERANGTVSALQPNV